MKLPAILFQRPVNPCQVRAQHCNYSARGLIKVQILDRSARITMSGRFDFRVHRDFEEAYTTLLNNGAVREIEVDMGKVDYMDSSALGMLLLLKECSGSRPIVLINASGMVSRLLEIANFDKIFSIRSTS